VTTGPRERLRGWRRVVAALALAAGVAGLLTAATARRSGRIYEDESEYLRLAANLSRHGALALSDPARPPERRSAYREPGYPVALAAAWRLAGTPAPGSRKEIAGFLGSGAAASAARGLGVALLALAAGAIATTVRRLGGDLAGALAFAAVAVSPALGWTSRQVMSEGLGATTLALAAGGLVALRRAGPRRAVLLLAALALLPLVRSEGLVLLPVALAVHVFARRSRPTPAGIAVAILVLVAPSVAWGLRNREAAGRFTLSDRGGVALAVRAELDDTIRRQGLAHVLAGWTPLASAERASARLAPQSTLLDYRPSGPGNFHTRTLRDWKEARAVGDPLAVDARLRREALETFARHPVAHLEGALAVAWRGLFAERSPAWAHPFDLRFGLGLLLGAAVLAAIARALRRGETERLLFVAPLLALLAFHVAATELHPRYATPLLPIAWGLFALLVGDVADRSGSASR